MGNYMVVFLYQDESRRLKQRLPHSVFVILLGSYSRNCNTGLLKKDRILQIIVVVLTSTHEAIQYPI